MCRSVFGQERAPDSHGRGVTVPAERFCVVRCRTTNVSFPFSLLTIPFCSFHIFSICSTCSFSSSSFDLCAVHHLCVLNLLPFKWAAYSCVLSCVWWMLSNICVQVCTQVLLRVLAALRYSLEIRSLTESKACYCFYGYPGAQPPSKSSCFCPQAWYCHAF